MAETIRWTGAVLVIVPLEGEMVSHGADVIAMEYVVPMVEEMVTDWLCGAGPPGDEANVNCAKLAESVGAAVMASVT